MSTAPTVDTILRPLTATELEERGKYKLKARDLKNGRDVLVWGLPGKWRATNPHPRIARAWWLDPRDDDAKQVVEILATKPSRGQPVVREVGHGHLVVCTDDLGAWSMVPLW